MMSDAEVAERRQAINEDAYFQVLKAMIAVQQVQSVTLRQDEAQAKANQQLQVSRTLRALFSIPNHQHKAWYDELRLAQQSGVLEAAPGPSARLQQHAAAPQHMAAASGRSGSKKQSAAGGGGSRAQPAAQGQQVMLQRTASRKGSKAAQQAAMQHHQHHQQYAQQQAYPQQQYQQPQQQQQQADNRMVGYKVNYHWQGSWLEGVITDYVPPNIIITFHLNTPSEFQLTVKWEQSESLVMKNEMVDLTAYRQRWQNR